MGKLFEKNIEKVEIQMPQIKETSNSLFDDFMPSNTNTSGSRIFRKRSLSIYNKDDEEGKQL